eukprot:TRINITY_DN1536_c0_g1_i1.p1 TRINITY_DN1536_c0_g1~~TRINITY_DN1536_c0_g1_i1.p1  ORF type:complete len:117 (+),score=30.20 TRINITY_DN1536_c0_g1_i1:84-434(+)
MDGESCAASGNSNERDGKILQNFDKNLGKVQNILDQNRMLIKEINQNHDSKIPDNLCRNVGLIKELNRNISQVVEVYSGLSTTFTKSVETSSEDDSAGTKADMKATVASGQKRIRP